MSLPETIEADFIAAMKARDEVKVRTLRSLKTALKNAEINTRGAELDDEAVQNVISKEAKQRKESIESFAAAGRDELSAREQEELEVLQAYLPEPLSEEEINACIDEVISDTGATGPADMGRVMGAVSAKTKGRADGSVVAGLVKNKLAAL